MKAVGKGKYKTTVEAPKNTSKDSLIKKAKKYIKGKFKVYGS